MIDRSLDTKEKILSFIKNEDREKAEIFFSLAEEENLREEMRLTAKYYSFTFFPDNSPRALFKMDLNEKTMRIKAQLFFIGEHNGDIDILSGNLKNMIKATPECTRCSMNCKQGTPFSMDGEEYFSCINEGHYFKDMDLKECRLLRELLITELRFIEAMKEK